MKCYQEWDWILTERLSITVQRSLGFNSFSTRHARLSGSDFLCRAVLDMGSRRFKAVWKISWPLNRRTRTGLEMSLNHFHKHNLRHLPRFPDFFVTFRILSPSSGRFLCLSFGQKKRILKNGSQFLVTSHHSFIFAFAAGDWNWILSSGHMVLVQKKD